MKVVLSKGRQVNMSQEAAVAPVILPSWRRLMMQQLARHAEHYVDDNQEQAAAPDHSTNEDHLVQQEAAVDHHQKFIGPMNSTPSLQNTKNNGLADHSATSYNDLQHHDKYIEHYSNNDHILRQEIVPDHYQKKGSSRASALHAKCSLPIQASYNDHHDKKYVEHYSTDDDHVVQQEVAADHQQKWGSMFTSSTLQAAQAQVAELRALHSAMLNNYGLTDQSSAAYNNGHQDKHTLRNPPADHLFYKSGTKKASKKKCKMHDDDESMQGPISSAASSASSTADCFIRPVHEYPIFMPSHEDNLLSNVEGVNLMNQRSSVDNYEALMREERLNYIFDHDNKRSFSGMFSDHSLQNNNISCLHESLNLPPRSAAGLTQLNNNDDRLLHHMSLNLPQGSQHHLFNSTKQNPLFRFNDDLHAATPSKLMKGKADQHAAHEIKAALPDLTGRQRALFEFLSEEPARMRAFNELASMEAPNYDLHPSAAGNVPKQKSNLQEDAAATGTRSFRSKGTYEPSRNVDQLQGSRDHHLHQKPCDYAVSTSTAPQVHPKLAHTDHPAQSSNIAGTTVSCDKCRPLAEVHTAAVPSTHSKNLGGDCTSANTAGAAAAATERPDQKKSSIKGWFFRGKKKHNSADHSYSQAVTASIPASKDRTPITSGAFSATKEMQSSAASTTTTAATSQVFSGLINTEAEKELEVAMAMDLMELKVLQANTKRDAAAAEVLELRLAMDSMAKKLVEVERHCVSLKTQLMDVQAMQQHDGILADHGNSTASANADPLNVRGDDQLLSNGAAGIGRDESDHYESDSQELRNERQAQAKVLSMIRAGVSSGYGGRGGSSSSRYMQPTKAEFLNAVAEARVGVKQVSRVLLQHIQESQGGISLQQLQGKADHQKAGVDEAAGLGIGSDQEGKGMISKRENERWGPIMMMCREAMRGDQLLQKG
eukprot:c25083_g1_i1 orf=124-2937(+)